MTDFVELLEDIVETAGGDGTGEERVRAIRKMINRAWEDERDPILVTVRRDDDRNIVKVWIDDSGRNVVADVPEDPHPMGASQEPLEVEQMNAIMEKLDSMEKAMNLDAIHIGNLFKEIDNIKEMLQGESA